MKGLTPDELTDPEEYQQLDHKQISVTQQTYEVVFDKVWTRWYKPLGDERGYWDDQDIARHLIENDRARPHFSAVFCDEAQDFTRIELELLLRFSVFSNRRIDPTDIARVPFIFAGDQFQTLNPTGFRWEAIKASFVEKFILALDPARRSRLNDLNYQELMLNYRSSRTIVRFSNFVQVLRARLFDLTGIQPQVPWDRDKGVPAVMGVKRDNADFWDQLKRSRDIAIIVPCGEGEELDFIRNDPTLSSKIRIEDKVPDALVLSSARAKGLEFNRVVVYGFGDVAEAKGDLLNPLRGKDSYANDPDKALPFQYFINRLYVAVSRPKRRLFIVDSEAAFTNFWAFAHDEGFESAILKGIKDGERIWRHTVGRLEFGKVGDLSADRVDEDPKKHADALARQGRANSDPLMLRYASASYRNLNDALEADRCKAEALKLEQNYVEAARVFLSCNLVKEAVDAFWRAGRDGGWKAIIETADTRPEINIGLEFAFSQLIVKPAGPDQAIKAFGRLAEMLNSTEQLPLIAGNPAWPVAIQAVMEKLSAIKAEPPEWSQLAMIFEKLAATTSLVSPSAHAWVQFRAGSMTRAVELWEQCKETTGKDYKVAKAYTTPFPEKIVHLVELERHSDAVQQCADHPDTHLPVNLAAAAARAHLQQGLVAKALHYASAAKSIDLVWEVAEACAENDEMCARALGALFALAAEKSELGMFVGFAERGQFGGRKPSPRLQGWIESHRAYVDVAWLRGMARAPAIAELKWDDRKSRLNQRPLADHLKKALFQSGRADVPPARFAELGTVIEYLGNRAEAVSFYEWILSAAPDRGTLSVKNATERWIVCKERQAKFEEGRSEVQLARVYRNEAKDMRISQGPAWISAVFPEFPDCGQPQQLIDELLRGPSPLLSSTSAPVGGTADRQTVISPELTAALTQKPEVIPVPSSPFPQKFETSIGQFKLEYFRPQQKLVLRNEPDGATASFKVGTKSAQAIDVALVELSPASGKFAIPAWSIEVDLSGPAGPAIRFGMIGVEVKFNHTQES